MHGEHGKRSSGTRFRASAAPTPPKPSASAYRPGLRTNDLRGKKHETRIEFDFDRLSEQIC